MTCTGVEGSATDGTEPLLRPHAAHWIAREQNVFATTILACFKKVSPSRTLSQCLSKFVGSRASPGRVKTGRVRRTGPVAIAVSVAVSHVRGSIESANLMLT